MRERGRERKKDREKDGERVKTRAGRSFSLPEPSGFLRSGFQLQKGSLVPKKVSKRVTLLTFAHERSAALVSTVGLNQAFYNGETVKHKVLKVLRV